MTRVGGRVTSVFSVFCVVGLTAVAVAGAGGCGARPGASGGVALRVSSGTSGAPGAPGTPCPSGTPLPAGQGESRDYVDEVRYNGRLYYAPPLTPSDAAPVDPARLGPVVGTVLCSKAQHDSNRRGEPEWTDPGSTFVPDGGSIYAVAGVGVDCQVAARSNDGRVHLYTAREPDRPAGCSP